MHHLHLVELVDSVESADVLAVAARLAPEAGRVGAISNGKRVLVEDLTPVQVGDRHLGGGDQERAVRDLIHLPLLVGQLPRGGGGGLVHQQRRGDLDVTGRGQPIEEVPGEPAHQARALPLEDREARAREGDTGGEVEPAPFLAQLPMGLQTRPGAALAALVDDHVVVLARPVRHGRVRQVRDLEQERLDLRRDAAVALLEALDVAGELTDVAHQVVGALPAAFALADLAAAGVALGLLGLELDAQDAPRLVGEQQRLERREGLG